MQPALSIIWATRRGRGLGWAASGVCLMCVRAHCAHALAHWSAAGGQADYDVLIARATRMNVATKLVITEVARCRRGSVWVRERDAVISGRPSKTLVAACCVIEFGLV
jgi:hypothetical protein